MAEYSTQEALAFIDAMRLTIQGKTGFKWMTEKLTDLTTYIEKTNAMNQMLNAYIDETGLRAEFESFRATHPVAADSSKGDS